MKTRSAAGNVLALLAVAFGIIVILGLIVINLVQGMGTHKQAQNAIDAAALEAAKQVSLITVASDLGRIGLVDFAGEDPNNPLRKQNPNSEAPVVSFNTALATVRLDLLIAQDLNNKDMRDLAERDLETLEHASELLSKEIANALKEGGPIWQQVKTTYNANDRRMGGPGALVDGSLKLIAGRLQEGQGTTNVPIPAAGPQDEDDAAKKNSTAGYYKPYVNIPAWGVNIGFAAIGAEPSLSDTSKFIGITSGAYAIPGLRVATLPPTVIKVEADNKVLAIAGDPKKPTAVLHNIACAQAGGQRLSGRSTAYTVGFAGSYPSETTFPQLTVKALLDHQGWQTPKQPSTWLKATSDKFPGAPLADNIPFAKNMPLIQSPSTALAYGIYDWLRSLGIRPTRKSVFEALASNKGDLRQFAAGKTFSFDDAGEPGEDDQDYADEEWLKKNNEEDSNEPDAPVLGCMIADPFADSEDAGYMALKNDSQEGRDLYDGAFNYRSAADSSPESAIPILVDPVTGSAKPPAGNSVLEMCQFVEGVLATNRAAVSSMMATKLALDSSRETKAFVENTFLPDASALSMAAAAGALGGNTALPQALQKVSRNIESYKALDAIALSPPSESVLRTFADFQAENLNDPQESSRIYQRWNKKLIDAISLEASRVEEMENRSMRVARNAKQSAQRTYAIMRRLLKYSGKGVRRLDVEGAGTKEAKIDVFPDSPVFISKIVSKSPRVNFVMPNNGQDIVRTGANARPHFFNLDFHEIDSPEIKAFKKSILSVQYDGSKFTAAQLFSGSVKMPVDGKYPKNDRWNWDTGPHGKKDGGPNALMGRFANKRYTRKTVEGGGSNDLVYVPLKDFKRLVKENFEGKDKKNKVEDTPPQGAMPGFEQVCVFTCDGDASNANSDKKGEIRITSVIGRDSDPRYPFGDNQIHKNQYLYYAAYSFKDGAVNESPNAPVSNATYRTVMARDQFADLRSGESYKLQTPQDWCQQYGVKWDSDKCPYPAGEWRMGNPYTIACCREPEGTGNKRQDRGRWSVKIPGIPFIDPDTGREVPMNDGMEEEVDICPRAVKMRSLHLGLRY
jgi:hypothetical protein